ncbi:serralysin-like metalloprotease [Pseudoduganella armeniaca]|uniref:Serralysin-like metalloprotease n=1 Tax=Pseudoduganella armeniaca TaxID=2072590 RepID=A0A2R4CH44_9BURK|nr:serralysin-like metalloprotease [Pseudoduganella armeniaca]
MLGGYLNVGYTGGANNKAAALGNTNALVSNQGGNLIAAVGMANVELANGSGNTLVAAGAGNLVATTVGGNTVVAAGGTNVVLTELGGMVKAAGTGLCKTVASVFSNKDAAKAVDAMTAKLTGAIASGSGNDKVLATGGTNVVYTGAGKDVVAAIGGANVILANGGDNVTTAIGGSNTIVNTAGNNVVTAVGGSNVIVTGLGDGVADVSAMLGKATGSTIVKQAATFIGNTLATGAGRDVVTAIGANNVAYTGSGDDVVTAIGNTNVAWTGTGNDVATAIGNNNVLWGDAGADTLTAAGRNNLVVSGNYAEVGATAVGLVDSLAAAASATDLVGKAGLAGAATAQNGTETMTVFGQNNILVGGSAKTVATVAGVNNLVVTGASDDVVTAVGSKTGVVVGAGNDVVTVIGKANAVSAGEGNNVITAIGKANVLEGGSGNDVITALSFGSVSTSVKLNGNVIVTGDGTNVATVVGTDNAIIGGSGKDTVVMVAYGGGQSKTTTTQPEGSDQTTTGTTKGDTQLNVAWTAGGNDTAVVYGSHNVLLTDSGDDFIVALNAGSKLSYASKTTQAVENGKDLTTSSSKLSIDTGMNFVHAGDGNDTAILAGTSTIGLGGNGNDLIVSSGQNNVAVGGEGNDVIIGLAEITVFNAVESLSENDYESAGDWVGAAMNANFIRSQYSSLKSGDLSKINLVGNVLLGGDGDDTVFATNAGSYVGGGNGNDKMIGLGWGLVDQILAGKTLNNAWTGIGSGFDAITKYVGRTLTADLAKSWDGIAGTIKTNVSNVTVDAGKLVDTLNGAGNSALAAATNAAGVASADFDFAGALKSALSSTQSGLNSAVNGIGSGVNYVADTDVSGAITDATQWLGSAVSTGSQATAGGLDWLGKQLGIDLHLSQFKGADMLVGGFIAYTLGYKYAGDNDLRGGAGSDTLYSGLGNDDLRGGSGTDTYVMSLGDGKDTIYEQAGGNDILKITGNRLFSNVTLSADKVKVNIDGGDLVINLVDGDTSYAKMTVQDYSHVNIAALDLVDASGSTVAHLAFSDLVAQAEHGADPYAMASVWTADRLATFSHLVTDAFAGDNATLVGVQTA